MPALPPAQRIRHPLPDQLGAVRPVDGLLAVLPAAGQLPGDPSDRVERRQLRTGEEGE